MEDMRELFLMLGHAHYSNGVCGVLKGRYFKVEATTPPRLRLFGVEMTGVRYRDPLGDAPDFYRYWPQEEGDR